VSVEIIARRVAPDASNPAARADDAPAPGPSPERPREHLEADVARASVRAADMAGGVTVERGDVLRLLDGADGFAVRIEVADLGADGAPSRLAVAADHAVITVSTRARPEQVERALAHRLTEAGAITARQRAGKPADVADALGKGATGDVLSPADLGRVAELRVLRRQLDEAAAAGPDGAERAQRLEAEVRQFENTLGLHDESPRAPWRRRVVETQVIVQNDRARREGARAALDGDRGHAGVEVHSHFMGVVDTEVFRQKAATADGGEDTGSWVPVLDKLAAFQQLRHAFGADGKIRKRSAAGDAFELVRKTSDRIAELQRTTRGASLEVQRAVEERIEMLAEDAARSALTATETTDFNSAYEVRVELV
jgi:histone H3/H4